MATKDAGKSGKNNKAPPRRDAAAEYKFTVETLAKDLDLQPASVRVALRKHEVEKADGGVYGWNSQKEYDAVKAELKAKAPAEKPKAKVKAAGTEKSKPKVKPVAKKAA